MANTPNLDLVKPTVGGDENTWGQDLNDNMDKLDAAFADGGVIIDSGVVSSSQATLDIDLPDAFAGWKLVVINLNPSTQADLLLRLSINGGSSYISGSTDYPGAARIFTSDNSANQDTYGSAAFAYIAPGLTASTSKCSRFEIDITSKAGANPTVNIKSVYSFTGGALCQILGTAGCNGSTSKVNKVRLYLSTGNINACAWALFKQPGLV